MPVFTRLRQSPQQGTPETGPETEREGADREEGEASAETAQAGPEKAGADAETAQAGPEKAEADAETAEADAEKSQADGETAEADAEESQADTVTAGAEAKRAQADAETAEAPAEKAETTHANAEQAPADAEAAHANAQQAAADAETTGARAEKAQAGPEEAEARTERAETTHANAQQAAADAETVQAPAEKGQAGPEEAGARAEEAQTGPGKAEAGAEEAGVRAEVGDGESRASVPGARLRRLRGRRGRHPRAARALRLATTALAAVLVLGALLLPNTLPALEPVSFARIPAEAVIGAVVVLGLPRRPRLVAAVLYGLGLTALTAVNLLDMGFNEYLGRGFNAALDWDLLPDAQAYVGDTLGGGVATAAAVGAVVLVLLVAAVMVAATVRLAGVLARHRTRATRGALIAGTVWITCSALGLTLFGGPIASERGAGALRVHAQRTVESLRDEAEFVRQAKADTFGNTPPDQLLPDLRGKDVIFTFIESYGRSAVEDPIIAPGVDRTLDTSTEALARAGFHARSGWLTSATFGGSSWLGHSTTMSGLWIDNQRRYRTVTAGDHLTLTKAFRKTGAWDTVGVMPGVQKGWPEEKWYGLDKLYDAFDLGYRGPKFSWSTMPDQYALEAFQRRVHGKKRDKPLMSFVILTSSHQPWAPIPKMVGWDELGDGTVFGPIQKAGNKAADIITDTTRSRQEYGKSIQYSVTSLTQWLRRYGTDDTVLVFLGDHQPMARVSGIRASRDVPVSLVAKDPKVLEKIADWNWTEGLKPGRDAPVWKMDSFRDRFLKAYGSTPHPSTG